MHRRKGMALTLIAVLLGAATPGAQSSPGPLVTTAWVAERLTDPNLVILHMGSASAYQTAHLPGARVVPSGTLGVDGTGAAGNVLSLQMPAPDALRQALEGLGISDTSRIVVYATSPNGVTSATRTVLTLQYAGLGDRTHLMQGGLTAWTAEGRATTAVVPEARTGRLSPLTIAPIVIDGDAMEVQRKAPGVRVVDARSPSFYDGVQTGGSPTDPHKTGHIEGAVNIPFSSTYDAQGRFKPVDELRALFTAAGVKPGERLIAYCHLGLQATGTIFAARLLGYDVTLYDGSFEDWSKRPNAAVTNPAAKN